MEPQHTRTDLERRIRCLSLTRHALSHPQLVDLGLGAGAIKYRLRSGSLVALYRGVYALAGAQPTSEQRWAAAVLACGETAALSHLSATALWALRGADPVVIDVSLTSRSRRRRHGIRVHRPIGFGEEDITRHNGIHDRLRQREKDATRDAWLATHGYQPRRFTYHQITSRPQEVLAALHAALA